MEQLKAEYEENRANYDTSIKIGTVVLIDQICVKKHLKIQDGGHFQDGRQIYLENAFFHRNQCG